MHYIYNSIMYLLVDVPHGWFYHTRACIKRLFLDISLPMSPNLKHCFQVFSSPVCCVSCVCVYISTQAQMIFCTIQYVAKTKDLGFVLKRNIFGSTTTRWRCNTKIHQVKVKHWNAAGFQLRNGKYESKQIYIMQINIFLTLRWLLLMVYNTSNAVFVLFFLWLQHVYWAHSMCQGLGYTHSPVAHGD